MQTREKRLKSELAKLKKKNSALLKGKEFEARKVGALAAQMNRLLKELAEAENDNSEVYQTKYLKELKDLQFPIKQILNYFKQGKIDLPEEFVKVAKRNEKYLIQFEIQVEAVAEEKKKKIIHKDQNQSDEKYVYEKKVKRDAVNDQSATNRSLDSELQKISSKPSYAKEKHPKFGITRKQLLAIKLLSFPFKKPSPVPTPEQLKIVQDFLKDIKGDTDLNDKLKKMRAMDLKEGGIDGDMLSKLMYYTYKTRNIDQFDAHFQKLKKNHNRIKNGMKLEEEHKISLLGYSIVYDVSRLKSAMGEFKTRGFLEGNSELEKLNKDIKEAAVLMGEVKKEVESDYRSSYKNKPGKMVFEDSKAGSWVACQTALSFFEKIMRKFVTRYDHAANLYTKDKKRLDTTERLSHINPASQNIKFSLHRYLYSDVYQIKIDKLIDFNNRQKLEEAFGKDWRNKLDRMYSKVEREIHDNRVKKFGNLKGGFDIWTLFSLGHKKIRQNDFNKIHDRIFSDYYQKEGKNKLLCSEFVAHTTIAAMVEINIKLREKLERKGIKIKEGEEIVKIPFGKHEDLHGMHPERLLNVLKKADCLVELKDESVAKKYFVIDRPKPR